jgi:hypothetical protein
MGTDETENELQMRGEPAPGMARVFTAWHGITRPEPGRTNAPFWINTEEEGRQGGAGVGCAQGRYRQGLGG